MTTSLYPEESDFALNEPTRSGPLGTATVSHAAQVIDRSGMLTALSNWESSDRTHAGGRPPYLTMRATLILWLVLACEQRPLHLRWFESALTERMTPKVAAILGITPDPKSKPGAMYERARRATGRIMRLIDARPLPNRQRRLTKAEMDEVARDRDSRAEELAEKARRARVLTNSMLEATYQMLPTRFRTERVSLAFDATPIGLYARGIGRERLEGLRPDSKVSVEPDAGFYVRTSDDHGDDGTTTVRKSFYALEAEFAVLTSNDASRPDTVPHVVLAIEQHAPGIDPTGAARAMFEDMLGRGHQFDHAVSDRLYMPGGNPEVIQNFLRSHGAKLVMSYPKHMLGSQEQQHGAILVEGTWYCPSMPTVLINATKERVAGDEADQSNSKLTPAQRRERRNEREQLWQARIAARAAHRLREKERPDDRGRVPMMCPAAGPSPTMTCPLKQLTRNVPGNRALLPVLNTPKRPGAICTNQTSTSFDTDFGGKLAQHYAYGSPEWAINYAHARNTVEAFNAYVKDGGKFNLANPSRRRLRGYTSQFFLVAITVAAANLEKIRAFLLELAERALDARDGIRSPEARTRRSRRSTPAARLTHRNRHSPPLRT